MDKLTKQFFGDAKRMQLSTQEKAMLWQGISTFASAKQISLSSLEKADGFDAIARHMHKNPMVVQQHSSVVNWFAFHKLVASTMVAVLIVGVGGGGVAYAAQAAVPGDVLYALKVDVTEPLIDRALTFDPARRAEWERRRLKRRLKEVEYLSSHDSFTPDHREHMQKRIEHRMNMLQEHLDTVPEDERVRIQNRVDDVMEKHQKFLERVETGDLLRPEEVRAFKQHVGGIRDKAKKKWGRTLQNVPAEVRERREERGLPTDRHPSKSRENTASSKSQKVLPVFKREMVPENVREHREELQLPKDRIFPKNTKNIPSLKERKPPPDNRKLDRHDGKLLLKDPLRKGIDHPQSVGFPPRLSPQVGPR